MKEARQNSFFCKIPENANYSIVTESWLVVLPRDGDKDRAERGITKGHGEMFLSDGYVFSLIVMVVLQVYTDS